MTNAKQNEVSMDEHLPAEVELREIGLSFTLGAGKNLSRNWQRELRTESESRFRAGVTRDGLEMRFSPPLLIDAQWPAMNMQLGGIQHVFSTGQTTVYLASIRGPTEGLIDFSEDAKKEIRTLLVKGLTGTPMAQLGYNPMHDRKIISTLESVTEHYRKQPSDGRMDVEYSDFGRVQIDMQLALKSDFRYVEKSAGLLVRLGTTIDVTLEGRGNMAMLMASHSNAARADAAHIETVTITSKGLLVILNDKPIAYLDRVRVDRGGAVTLENLRLEGVAGQAEGLESLVRVIASAVNWTSTGAALEPSATMAAHSSDALAKLVPDMVRTQIEKTLTEGTKKLLRANRTVIPEVDLEEAFLT